MPDHPIYTYGIDNPYCRFKAYDIEPTAAGSVFTIDYGCGEQRGRQDDAEDEGLYRSKMSYRPCVLLNKNVLTL